MRSKQVSKKKNTSLNAVETRKQKKVPRSMRSKQAKKNTSLNAVETRKQKKYLSQCGRNKKAKKDTSVNAV